MRKRFYQTALGNCYGLKLPKCELQFARKKIIVSLITIFGTFSFRVAARSQQPFSRGSI